jgi:Flp pilus assembly protein TadD
MEVAVNKSIVSLFMLGLTFALGGCADVVTYSGKAKNEGMKLYQQGDYADAAGAFRESARQMPTNYEAYYYLGACYDQMGQFQQAIPAFKTALETSALTLAGKEDVAFHNKIIDGLAGAIAQSDIRDAEIDRAQKDAQEHSTSEAWYLLAKIYAYRGDADSAIDAYNRASLLEPNNFYIEKDYGMFMEKLGQNARAEAPLRRAYSLNSNDPQVAESLRRIGVVPGPSILNQNQLAQPLVPKGPIPELHVPNLLPGSTASTAQPTAEAPRD